MTQIFAGLLKMRKLRLAGGLRETGRSRIASRRIGKQALHPKCEHILGTTARGEPGRRDTDIFGMKAGDMLMVLGDEVPGLRGLALVGAEELMRAAKKL